MRDHINNTRETSQKQNLRHLWIMLPDELNSFYGRIDLCNKLSAVKSAPALEELPLSVSTDDMKSDIE